MVSGMSLRLGYALGLHKRNEDRTSSAAEKEIRKRIWWGVYSLETVLSTLTVRPSAALESYCSVPLPLPLPEEEIDEAIILSRFGDPPRPSSHRPSDLSELSSVFSGRETFASMNEPVNSGSYLKAATQINMIIQDIHSKLYSETVVTQSWESVQKTIIQLKEQLETWSTSLPVGLRAAPSRQQQPEYLYCMNLKFYYYNARIMMVRNPGLFADSTLYVLG